MDSQSSEKLLHEALELEREAQRHLVDQKHEKAYEANHKAAGIFSQIGKHEQAGLCFTQAASCWNKHIGQLPVVKAAQAHQSAAEEFLKVKDFHNAMLRFADAAFLYEKDGDHSRFSHCFYESKQAQGKFAWMTFFQGRMNSAGFFNDIKERVSALGQWIMNRLNRLLWGYGERPFRTLSAAIKMILLCAVVYKIAGPIQTHAGSREINLGESLYLSAITFSTVGYGDYLPLSLAARAMAAAEAMSGIILMPLFLIALTRRYLRTSR